MGFCTECGVRLADSEKYCSQCGTKVECREFIQNLSPPNEQIQSSSQPASIPAITCNQEGDLGRFFDDIHNNDLENKICPLCKADSLVPWKIRVHDVNQITQNPLNYVVGLRCEKCAYTVVYKPNLVFASYKTLKEDDAINNPNLDEGMFPMLIQAIERCVIDHKKDCIPLEVWNVVTPRVRVDLVNYRLQETAGSKKPLPREFWESFDLTCYEANGLCVWGLD